MSFPVSELRLSDAQAARVRAGGRHFDFRPGHVLTLEGARPDKVFLLTRGVVKVASVSVSGASKLLAIRGRGQLVGEFGCIDGGPRSGTAAAVTKGSAWEIPGDLFLRALHSDAELCFAVLKITVGRVRESDEKIGELGTYSAADRVIRLLARLAVSCADGVVGGALTIPVDQSELAGCAGVVRETVSRTVTMLARDGIAHGGRGRIVIDDLPALIHKAQQTDSG